MSVILMDDEIKDDGTVYGIRKYVNDDAKLKGLSLPMELEDRGKNKVIRELEKNYITESYYPGRINFYVRVANERESPVIVQFDLLKSTMSIGYFKTADDDRKNKILDSILKGKAVSEILTKYWVEEEEISEDKARSRLEEIAPLNLE